jgi:hypothetical protein
MGDLRYLVAVIIIAVVAFVVWRSGAMRAKIGMFFQATPPPRYTASLRTGTLGGAPRTASATIDRGPPNEYVAEELADLAGWKRAIHAEFTKDGLSPDSVCLCYKQDGSDRSHSMDYLDAGIGVYNDAKFLRFVVGTNDRSKSEENFCVAIYDLNFSAIKKVILRRRTSPPWQQHTRAADGTYPDYAFYYQTRIYTETDASYAPKGQESRTRLLEARYVFDWICKYTGADRAEDSQEKPLDGYPEGV